MRVGFFGDSLTAGVPGVSYVDLLRERLPDMEMINYGRGGDSVIGTRERIEDLDLERFLDVAFVWTGVNDILPDVRPTFPATRRLLGEPWTRSSREFLEEYRRLLDRLCQIAEQIVCVPPLFIGEDPSSRWNRQLERLGRSIRALLRAFERTRFIDLRDSFPAGDDVCHSHFIRRSGLATVWEALTLRTPEEVDRVAEERGLCYTLDGVHLNSRGANVVADVFEAVLRDLRDDHPARS